MAKKMTRKLIANSEKKAIEYSKFLKVALRAIGKEVAKELNVPIKAISVLSHVPGTRQATLTVETRKPIEAEAFKALQQELSKYSTFCTIALDLEHNTEFSVVQFVDQPFGFKPS